MYTLLVTLHVLAAVLLIGPFTLAAFGGQRAIRRRDPAGTRDATRWMSRFGLGSLAVALLGMGALGLSDTWSFRTPWVIISLTLYLVAMGVATGYTVPALRKATKLVQAGVLEQPAPGPDGETTAVTTTGQGLAGKEQLDRVAGRIAGSGALVLAAIVVITILMVTHPFGK